MDSFRPDLPPYKTWNLYEGTKELSPLKFSNGKTQEDIVNEILKEIRNGRRIILIKGVCGTGKSAIALNIAKELGKASIVVPIKNLQKQYEQDYTQSKYLIKNNKRLKIEIIKGRQNFECKFSNQPKKKEKNSTLDIFESPKIFSEKVKNSCDDSFLPCKIDIKDKNFQILRDYVNMNKNVRNKNLSIKEIKRLTIAPICPYWSPIVSSDIVYDMKDAEIFRYTGLCGKTYSFYKREEGCGYYDQYLAYINSDVLIFNSEKYKLETLMNRKPFTDVEIIDECDEFLDSFSESGVINLNRLVFALNGMFSDYEKINTALKNIGEKVRETLFGDFEGKEMIPLKETPMLELIKIFVENDIMSYVDCDEENYCYHAEEIAKTFYDFSDETFLFFERKDRDFIVKLVTVDLSKRFHEIVSKNKAFVLMSGTIHSENILKEVFGLSDFKIIEAETELPGKVTISKTGLEINCKYENFKYGKVSREQYLRALDKCIKQAIKPALVHVISFSDLPTEDEAKNLGLTLMTREKLKEEQKNADDIISGFKSGNQKILYTTRCNRGMDFPGEMCNSIVLTKYPYPDISGPFWKLLKKIKPEYYNDFYIDKARREFFQRIYRGLRFKGDHVYLLSPDSRVFDVKI